jgi:outer membrane protein assembly factor BamD (BamD/ComL family)
MKWASHALVNRAAYARFYLGKMLLRAGKWDRALETLEFFASRHPGHRFVTFAHLMRADALTEIQNVPGSIAALEAASRAAGSEALRAEIDLRTGLAHLRQQEYVLAATSLNRAAENSELLREAATYNAALAWLGQGNLERFHAEYQRLVERGAAPELRGNLVLEAALTRARTRDAGAEAALRAFMEQFPKHPRLKEAHVAIAELKMVAGELDEASRLLRVSGGKKGGAALTDQEACLAIFLSDSKSPRNDEETERLAQQFLRERPKSPLRPDVLLKLGQVAFRQGNYPNAETQFVTFARETPSSPSAESALYLAGQAAMRSYTDSTERALAYFDEVVQRNGSLKLHAREQQAIIQVRLGKEQEAVALYDLIINSRQPVPDAELRNAALIGKGEALALLGRKDPQQLAAAIAVYDEVAAAEDVSASWLHQALYQKARLISEQTGRRADALALYNEILDRNLAATQREFFWFYKAGFEAARLFEQHQQWPSAIAIYEKIGRIDGPHAEEAREKARKMRVEHFVWD